MLLAAALTTGQAPAFAAPDAPVGVLAPAPGFDAWAFLRDAGIGTATSGLVLGLAFADGGRGPLGGLGGAGQLALVGLACAVPPAGAVALNPTGFHMDDYVAALSGGLVGLGLGYVLTSGLGGTSPTGLDYGLKALGMALGQGIGGATALHLYQGYRPTATDLDRLPENRTDDPIDNWNLRRERQHP
jgi:hypothetical protein